MPWSLRVGVAVLLAVHLVSCTKEVPPATELYLHIGSTLPGVEQVELLARNEDYRWDRLVHDLAGRDISASPLVIRLTANDQFGYQFLAYAKGYIGGSVVVAKAAMLELVTNQRQTVTIIMDEVFPTQDADGDGFRKCGVPLDAGELCDCQDRNAKVNPFTKELCDDVIDNNCSGYPPNENCEGCIEDLPCTSLPQVDWAKAGVGACRLGVQRCVAGKLADQCEGGDYQPQPEIAGNFIDDDCDGATDEGSSCTAGATRPCFLGWVDDESNPIATDPEFPEATEPWRQATLRARGECLAGVQACDAQTQTWGTCDDEVRPQPDPRGVGYKELDAADGAPAQCDGKDNDCDGLYDEEPYFDADRDGYTFCGTPVSLVTPAGGGEAVIVHDQPGLAAEFIDCDDDRDDVNPGQQELCGNEVDEDCRCDHDPPATTESRIGSPYNTLDGATNCGATQAYLSCNLLPRSDANPTGSCLDGPDVYYSGFSSSGSGEIACFKCRQSFGETCDSTTLACVTKDAACCQSGACPASSNADADVAAYRPVCATPVTDTCTCLVEPSWTPLATGADDYGDCSTLSCADHYAGITAGQCVRRRDPTPEEVSCAGKPLCVGGEAAGTCCDPADPTSCCQSAADVCPGLPARTAADMPPTCQVATDGCQDTTPPIYTNQPAGSDQFEHCTQPYQCAFLSGQSDYHLGISGSPAYCYVKDDVANNACNGSGACQSRAEACTAVTTGIRPVPRAAGLCRVPTGGCDGTTAPVYGSNVAHGTDPYDDCPGSVVCCDGACCKQQGASCGGDGECQSGHCVDGVCCESACDGTCNACSNALTGQTNGLCRSIASVATDVQPTTLCSGSTGCSSTSCICEAGTTQCKIANNAECTTDASCVSGNCECANAGCSIKKCSAVDCDCRYNTDGNNGCDGNLSDGVDDVENSCGTLTCNGAGACNLGNNTACSFDSQCESNNCECADASCNTKKCSAVDCDCRYNNDGNNGCDGNLSDGVDDVENSCGLLTCNGAGGCNLPNNATCSSDSQCESNLCECANSSCSAKECGGVDCDCRYNTDGDNDCDGNLADGVDDADNSCGSLTCNGAGACNLANNTTCSFNSQCESNNCECADASCSAKKCSAIDCDCRYNTDGDSDCDGNLSDGVDDVENSCGSLTCNGSGACNLANNVVCTTNAACESNHCEYVDTSLTTKKCSNANCDCMYNTDGNSSCDGNLPDGVDDAEDSCGALTCNGSGACHLANNTTCLSNSQCESNNCECADASCSTKKCSGLDCDCRYNGDGDNDCDGSLNDGVDDGDDSCGASLTCNGSGACHLAIGQACATSAECESDICDCANAGCSSSVCAASACNCWYDSNGDGACDGTLSSNVADPNWCSGTQACDGAGACLLIDGQLCSADAECLSNNCAAPAPKKCAP